VIFINFKTYQEATGKKALELAKACQAVAKEASVEIVPIVQAVDIFRLANAGFKVWAQHVDDIEYGPNTGQILPEAVLAAGAKGTVLNHSENKLPAEMVKTTLVRCQVIGLKTLVFAASIEEAEELVAGKPDFLAYEPPEFIGSRTASVASAKQGVIKEFVDKIKTVPILVGAGIHSRKDVETSLRLGAKGVLVASDVVLAENPKKELLDLTKGFKDQK
jgi:triosephosphate isomerase